MKNLGRAEDVKASTKAITKEESHFLKIPEAKTPWYLISLDYVDGFVHWYEGPQGRRRVVCKGGIEGKGFAVDECPICAYVLDLYNEAKELENDGDEDGAKKLRGKAKDAHAKAEFQFKAIRGNRVLIKTKKDGKVSKKWVADWDTDDEDSNAEAGVLGLSEAQFKGLTGMIGSEDTPYIESGDDLGNRILWSAKERRSGKTGGKYSAVVWTADAKATDMPDFEIPEEVSDINLEDSFTLDEDEVDKVAALLTGQESEAIHADEVVATEDAEETDDSEEPDDSDLDDIEDDDEDEDEDDPEDEPKKFDDDLPDEPVKKKKSTKKGSGKARL